jgi:hypothetical protein
MKGLYNPALTDFPDSVVLGLSLPLPTPFIFSPNSQKTKSPNTTENSRPFLGFSSK